VAAWGDGADVLATAGIPDGAPGVVRSTKANKTFAKDVIASLTVHRHWDRLAPHPTRRPADQPDSTTPQSFASPSQSTAKKGR